MAGCSSVGPHAFSMLCFSIASVAVVSLSPRLESSPIIVLSRTNFDSFLLHFFALGSLRSAKSVFYERVREYHVGRLDLRCELLAF